MFKQEDFKMLNDYSHPNSNIRMEVNYIINGSPPFSDIDINDLNIIPLMPGDMHGELLVLSPQQLEDTMDAATKYEPREYIPVSPRGPPERTVFAGDADFQVEISAQDTHKKKYLYSNQLNRIYVDMKMDFPVSFRWNAGVVPTQAYVRATVVFAEEAQAEKRVERCTQHTHEVGNADINQQIVKNVLHSSRERGTHGVYYCGIPELADSWYSVLVELGPTGGSHAFQFVCKNSCSSGINRRATDVIFTLEDANGHVYGRQTVGARSCSCPRRDMNRDEEEEQGVRPGKRRLQRPSSGGANGDLRNKKIKIETVTDNVTLTLEAPNPQTARAMAEAARLALEHAARYDHTQPLQDKFKHCLQVAQTQVDQFTNATD